MEIRSFHCDLILIINIIRAGLPLVVQWLRLHSQCRGPGFDPWSGNQIPHGTTKTSAAKQIVKYGWLSGKESACQCKRCEFDPWVRKIPWRRKRQPTPVFLPGKFHGQRSLAGYSPQDHKESDTTEWASLFTFTNSITIEIEEIEWSTKMALCFKQGAQNPFQVGQISNPRSINQRHLLSAKFAAVKDDIKN